MVRQKLNAVYLGFDDTHLRAWKVKKYTTHIPRNCICACLCACSCACAPQSYMFQLNAANFFYLCCATWRIGKPNSNGKHSTYDMESEWKLGFLLAQRANGKWKWKWIGKVPPATWIWSRQKYLRLPLQLLLLMAMRFLWLLLLLLCCACCVRNSGRFSRRFPVHFTSVIWSNGIAYA